MLSTLWNMVSHAFSLMEKEASVLRTLDRDVRVTLKRFEAQDPGLADLLKSAYGYAVFPSIGKAAAVVGGAFGKGEVFERGEMIGYAAVAQLTIGVQIGGDTFSELILFENAPALNRFKQGKVAFAAGAAAVLLKAGASTMADYERGAAVFVHSEGGMMLEAAIGGQKFFYRPAALGKLKPDPRPRRAARSKTPRRGPTRSPGRKTKTAGLRKPSRLHKAHR